MSSRVRPPATGLPPQSFGRNNSWHGPLFIAFALVIFELVEVYRWIFVLHGRFHPGDFLFPLILYAVLTVVVVIFAPETWMAGGDGWLMLLRGRRCIAWVRTSRLVYVSLDARHKGDVNLSLTLSDAEGRYLKTRLRNLTAEAASSLLAGLRQSPETALSAPGAQRAVTALGELAQDQSAPP